MSLRICYVLDIRARYRTSSGATAAHKSDQHARCIMVQILNSCRIPVSVRSEDMIYDRLLFTGSEQLLLDRLIFKRLSAMVTVPFRRRGQGGRGDEVAPRSSVATVLREFRVAAGMLICDQGW